MICSIKGFHLAHNGFHKGGFAHAVATDYAKSLTFFKVERHLCKGFVVAYDKVIYVQHLTRTYHFWLSVCPKGAGVVSVRSVHNLHLFNEFDFGLHHTCLCGLIAESFNKFCEPFNLCPLQVVILLLFFVEGTFLLFKGGVITLVAPCFTPLYFIDLVHDFVEEHTVVGYDDKGGLVGFEIVLKPLDCFNVEVVCWLVKEQNVGL